MAIVASIRPASQILGSPLRSRRTFGHGILAPEPAVSVPSEVRRRWAGPTDADQAWHTAFTFGYQGVLALPPSDWCDVIKDSFFLGLEAGERQADADKQAAFDSELAMLASLNSEEGRSW